MLFQKNILAVRTLFQSWLLFTQRLLPYLQTNVHVTDTLPVSVTYVYNSLTATTGDYGYDTGVITWTGSVNAGAGVMITFGATATETAPLGASIANAAIISGGGEIITRTATVHVVTWVYLPLVLKGGN